MIKKQTQLQFPANHPVFGGHFPGTPIVPGVMLLDAVMHAVSTDTERVETSWQISAVKFLNPLKPDQAVIIQHEQLANGSIKFEVVDGDRQIVTGQLVARPMASSDN